MFLIILLTSAYHMICVLSLSHRRHRFCASAFIVLLIVNKLLRRVRVAGYSPIGNLFPSSAFTNESAFVFVSVNCVMFNKVLFVFVRNNLNYHL